MRKTGALQITTPSDREIVMTRTFDAPRRLVWDAYTKPELLTQWLGVFGGWTFAVCEIDLRVGGRYRWVWQNPDGYRMGMGGVYQEIDKPERIVCTEKFDDPWYEGEGLDTVEFTEENGRTTLTTTVLYDSKAARDSVLASPMEQGVAAGYDKLQELLESWQNA